MLPLEPRKLQLGAARLLKHELVGGKFHQIYCRSERGFDFDSVLVAELISAADLSDEDASITKKFPNCLVFSTRHSPFANDAGVAATGQQKQRNRRRDGGQQMRAPCGNRSDHGRVITGFACRVEPKENFVLNQRAANTGAAPGMD